jgi:hypothetical protein
MAGTCKRLWLADKQKRDWLLKANRGYARGWESSKKTNAYLGINAATTSLWLEKGSEARARAGEVRALLEKRRGTLRHSDGRHGGTALNYWDLATLAEAELVSGDLDSGLERYREAFDLEPAAVGKHKVSRGQATAVLAALGFSPAVADAYWTRARPNGKKPRIHVGVTGHRRLADPDSLRPRIVEVAEQVERENPGKQLVVVSPLAEGADRLVADILLKRDPTASLEVVLPFEYSQYLKDFSKAESRDHFQELYDRASAVIYPVRLGQSPASEPPEDGYARCGAEVVRRSDVMIAIWDGKPAAGKGGTGDIVELARRSGKPLVWLKPGDAADRLGS